MEDLTLQRRMTALARDLESERSAEATLHAVVTSAHELVGPCAAAGITLASREGEVRTSAATDSVPRRGDELQIELGEGPCRDAVWQQHTVLVRDLPRDHRWPRWAPKASDELGMRSMLCLRLFTHHDRIGALNLYAEEQDAFDEQEVEIGHAVAAHAAVAVVAAEKIEQLEAGLVNRSLIGQAIGLLMKTYDLTDTDAFSFLARVSSQTNRKVALIAQELVRDHDRQVGERRNASPRPRMPGSGSGD